MIVHLAIATLVLGIIVAAAHVLPLRARTRCAVMLLGIAQFFLPAAPPRLLRLTSESGPAIIRIVAAPLTAPGLPVTKQVNWIAILWASIAALLLVRALLAYRSVARMTARATSLPPRDGIAIARSSEIDTPALAGLWRPVILLPAYAEELDERAVDALILHERAHLTRRDNLAIAFETVASALLWFHPLVWWTRRAIAVAREEACDEIVLAATPAAAYIDALDKVCRAALAPRSTTLSCMASNRLAERIEYMNKVSTFRTLSHRAVFVGGMLFVAAAAVAGGVANEPPPAKKTDRYLLRPKMTQTGAKQVDFDVQIVDTQTGEVIAEPRVAARFGVPATVRTGSADAKGNERDVFVEMRSDDGKRATVTLRIEENGAVVQTSHLEIRAKPVSSAAGEQTITINLKDADIADVAKTFGTLTGKTVELGPGVRGMVTINVTDVPWTDALRQVAAQAGARVEINGDVIRILR